MRRAVVLAALALLVLPPAARAQLAEPSPVPAAPDAELARLNHERAELMGELDDLRGRIAAHNQRCSHVATTDTALTATCEASRAELQQRLGIYKAGLSTYESDPMVVNAQGIPSGLPPDVDAALAKMPESDRLRKGYQAVMAHDWKLARAWFQDAHNHAPGDAGIARVVDLALEAEATQAASGAPLASPAYERYLQHRQDPAAQARWSAFIKNDLPRHPELTEGFRATWSLTPAGPLTAQQAQARAAQLRLGARKVSDTASQESAYGVFADPRSDIYRFETEASDLHAAVAAAMEQRAKDVEACRCEPPLQRPADSDIAFLFQR
jgi:hypothetical protein